MENSTENCTICLEDIESNIEFLPCAHKFHETCIYNWLKIKDTCPMCKIPIYIENPRQLSEYNVYRQRVEEEERQENMYYQQVSAGLYNLPLNGLPGPPPLPMNGLPGPPPLPMNGLPRLNPISFDDIRYSSQLSIPVLARRQYDNDRLELDNMSQVQRYNGINNIIENLSESINENIMQSNSGDITNQLSIGYDILSYVSTSLHNIYTNSSDETEVDSDIDPLMNDGDETETDIDSIDE